MQRSSYCGLRRPDRRVGETLASAPDQWAREGVNDLPVSEVSAATQSSGEGAQMVFHGGVRRARCHRSSAETKKYVIET